MTLNPFRLLVFLVFFLVAESQSASIDDVADQVDAAVQELRDETVVKSLREVPPVASKHLRDYTDAQRLRGIDVWMDRAKGKERVWMPGFAGDLLKNDPDLIKDSSELRKLLLTEDDPSGSFFFPNFPLFL